MLLFLPLLSLKELGVNPLKGMSSGWEGKESWVPVFLLRPDEVWGGLGADVQAERSWLCPCTGEAAWA